MASARKPFLETAWAASAGLFVGAVAAAVNQQLLAGALYWDCRLGGPAAGLVLSLAAGAITVLAAAVSWRARGPDPGPRRFLAEVSLGSAGIFLAAIVAMGLASVLVPSCHR